MDWDKERGTRTSLKDRMCGRGRGGGVNGSIDTVESLQDDQLDADSCREEFEVGQGKSSSDPTCRNNEEWDIQYLVEEEAKNNQDQQQTKAEDEQQ